MVNLVVRQKLLDDRMGNAQRERKKPRDTSCADIINLWHSEKVALLANSWKDAQLTQFRKLSWAPQRPCAKITRWGHVQRSQDKVTCRGHMQELRIDGIQVAWSNLHLQMGGVVKVQTVQVKCRYQLIVRLKAIKFYKGLLCYLSFYTPSLAYSLLLSPFCL